MLSKLLMVNYWWSMIARILDTDCVLSFVNLKQDPCGLYSLLIKQSASQWADWAANWVVLPGGKTQNKGGRAKRDGTKGASHHPESLNLVHCTLASIFNVRGINYQIYAGEFSWKVCNWGETQKGGRDKSELGNLTREGPVRMARVSGSFTHRFIKGWTKMLTAKRKLTKSTWACSVLMYLDGCKQHVTYTSQFFTVINSWQGKGCVESLLKWRSHSQVAVAALLSVPNSWELGR